MTDWTSVQIPPPADWPVFERLCHRLWIKLWGDPNAQRNGRGGQRQHGVDVFGSPKDSGTWAGVQCKGKDGRYGAAVKKAELRAEVKKALKFEPALNEFIIATTAPNDARIQNLAREITNEHKKKGLFSVHVLGWGEIERRLSDHCPEIIEDLLSIRPSGTAIGSEIVRKMDSIADQNAAMQAQILQNQQILLQRISVSGVQIPDSGNSIAHAQLDQCRDLLRDHLPKAAQRLLLRLLSQDPPPPGEVLFRIHTNLGAAYLALGDPEKASDHLLLAATFDGASEKGAANRALALLIQGRNQEAIEAAKTAIQDFPASAIAWAAWINICGQTSLPLPTNQIPSSLTDSADVLFALGNAYASCGDFAKAEGAFRRALEVQSKDFFTQVRLAESLVSQASQGGELFLGVSYSEQDVRHLEEAGELFNLSWEAIRQTEIAAANVSIPTNRCAIHLALGELKQARTLVDSALPISPKDPGLVRIRIQLAILRGDPEEVREALESLTTTEDKDFAVLKASALRFSDPRGALRALEQFMQSGGVKTEKTLTGNEVRGEELSFALCAFADIVCEVDPEHAESRFDSLPRTDRVSFVRSTLIFAQSLLSAKGALEARRYLNRARSELTGSDNTRDRLLLADTLFRFDDWSEAIEIYEACVSTFVDTPSLRNYAIALLNCDRRQALLALFQRLPTKLQDGAFYLWLKANLAIRAGDLQLAFGLLERRVGMGGPNLSIRIRWAQVCFHIGRTDLITDWLDSSNIDFDDIGLDDLLDFGGLLLGLGRSDDAAAVFYQARRRFPHEVRAHLGLVSMMFFVATTGG